MAKPVPTHPRPPHKGTGAFERVSTRWMPPRPTPTPPTHTIPPPPTTHHAAGRRTTATFPAASASSASRITAAASAAEEERAREGCFWWELTTWPLAPCARMEATQPATMTAAPATARGSTRWWKRKASKTKAVCDWWWCVVVVVVAGVSHRTHIYGAERKGERSKRKEDSKRQGGKMILRVVRGKSLKYKTQKRGEK